MHSRAATHQAPPTNFKESPASHTLEMSDLVLFSFSFHLGMVIGMVVASMFLSFGFQAFIFLFISGMVILIILC